MNVVEDGLSSDPQKVTASMITEDAQYGGVRGCVRGNLGSARVSLQKGEHHRRKVPGYGKARRPEQPDEGLLRYLGPLP